MKRTIILFLAAVMGAGARAAVPIDTLFAKMPDRLLPVLDWDNRLDCLDLYNSKMRAEVTNVFGERSRLVAKTEDYLRVDLSASSRMELKVLPHGADTIVGLIHTVLTPAADSRIDFFTPDWKPLDSVYVRMPESGCFWKRPDSMTAERYDELRSGAGIPWVEASFSPEGDTLTMCLSLDNVRSDWREDMERCMQKVAYRWNGSRFEAIAQEDSSVRED